nr:hypothetical protein CFP56_39001 [Quercus suber]
MERPRCNNLLNGKEKGVLLSRRREGMNQAAGEKVYGSKKGSVRRLSMPNPTGDILSSCWKGRMTRPSILVMLHVAYSNGLFIRGFSGIGAVAIRFASAQEGVSSPLWA